MNNCEFILYLLFFVWFVIEVVLFCFYYGIYFDFVDDGIRLFIGRLVFSFFFIIIRRLILLIIFWISFILEKLSLFRFEMLKMFFLVVVFIFFVEWIDCNGFKSKKVLNVVMNY